MADTQREAAEATLQDLHDRLGRLAQLNAALWELLKERTGLIDAELDARVLERAATADAVPACHRCGKPLHPKHGACLYCGTPRPRGSPFDRV
jgi:hypothetical protein